jgi:uncharacterized membrane protein
MKILGHPVHPMLIVFPVGLLVTAVIFDAVDVFGGSPTFGTIAYWNIVAGLVGAVLAAATGLADWLKIPAGTRAKKIGIIHAALNSIVLIVFLIVAIARTGGDTKSAGVSLFALEVLAIAIAGASAWYGGELAYRHGIGVEPGAHADSPGSLSRRPADERA